MCVLEREREAWADSQTDKTQEGRGMGAREGASKKTLHVNEHFTVSKNLDLEENEVNISEKVQNLQPA